jgi:SAM-dependent methyltransferase
MCGIRATQGSRDAVGFFDSGAAEYLECAASQPGFIERFALFERQIELARRRLGSLPTCVDLGCGPGTLALQARRRGFGVIGIDGSAAMLAHAHSSAQRVGLDVDFRQARLPLEGETLRRLEGSADLLIASSVIEYMSDDLAFARQCRGLLAPRGICLISFANGRSAYRAMERRLARTPLGRGSYLTVQRRQYDVSRARRLFARVGLHASSVHYFGMPGWGYRLWPAPARPPWLATLFLMVLTADAQAHEGS